MISRPSIAVIAAFLLIGTAGCTASPAKPTESEMTAPADANAPDEVRGIAENAKGGAVIIAESGEVVYLAGVDEWPAELRGKKVVARGTLEETDYIPGARRGR